MPWDKTRRFRTRSGDTGRLAAGRVPLRFRKPIRVARKLGFRQEKAYQVLEYRHLT